MTTALVRADGVSITIVSSNDCYGLLTVSHNPSRAYSLAGFLLIISQ